MSIADARAAIKDARVHDVARRREQAAAAPMPKLDADSARRVHRDGRTVVLPPAEHGDAWSGGGSA